MANKNGELFLVKYNNTPNSDRIVSMFYRGGRKVIELDKFAKIKEDLNYMILKRAISV